MASTPNATVHEVNFSRFEPEAHVVKALHLGLMLADGKPLDAVTALRGILIMSQLSKSTAFTKLRGLVSPYKAEIPQNMRSEANPHAVQLDHALYESFKIARKYFQAIKNIWGRDYVTFILLTKDQTLADFLNGFDVNLDHLRYEWFNFVNSDQDRSDIDWRAWWRDANVFLPGSRAADKPADPEMQETGKRFDIVLVHNSEDGDVAERINKSIKDWGFGTYFWKTDLRPGESWSEKEPLYVQSAKLVVILLGNNGWGKHHLMLAEQAVKLGRKIVPVLIGNASKEARAKVGGLFVKSVYLDLTRISDEKLNELKRAITEAGVQPVDPRSSMRAINITQLIQTLTNGNERERASALDQIINTRDIANRSELSERLRSEINRYHLQGNSGFYTALRAPEESISIRSWMISCLIWNDAEDEANRELLMRHLDDKYEPAEHVRFWCLAGLYQKTVSYLDGATTAVLRSRSLNAVHWLAQIIIASEQKRASVLFELLKSDDLENRWIVLRVLRIVPVVVLAADVCALLDKEPELGYDVFYALIPPEMAAVAAKHLTVFMGTARVVGRLCSVLQNADPNGRRNLSRFLLAFDRREVHAALTALLENEELKDVAAEVMDHLGDPEGDVQELAKPGFRSDGDGKDLLDIEEDVKTLTAVILAKDVTPPLAIGLFGDWGHGKSFFMKAIRGEVKATRKRGNEKIFCTNAVQIEFNAWHYVDTNLWASLVSHILSELSNYVSPKATFEEQHTGFLKELASTTTIIEEAKAQQKIAQKEIEIKQEELRKLQAEREQKRIRLKELRPEDIFSALEEKDKTKLKQLLGRLGLPSALKSVADLEVALKETTTTAGRISTLFFSLLRSRNILIIAGFLILVIGIIPWGFSLMENVPFLNRIANEATAIITKAAAVISGVAITLKSALQMVNSGVSRIEAIKNEAEKILAAKRSQPGPEEKALEKEINDLNAREHETKLVLTSATRRVADLQERIRLLKEERSLNRFLVERTNSEDYRKHLGIISTIRQDFETLTNRLATAYLDDSTKYNKVDRIILYIDDLDRCPSAKVVEVLQAVHLLLAYPLFVVIVGVDPRWLLHSLESSYSAFQHDVQTKPDVKQANEWLTTPQNFLEKIFQVQFSLKPMSRSGYGRLIKDLFTDAKNNAAADHTEERAENTDPRKATNDPPVTPSDKSNVEDQPLDKPVQKKEDATGNANDDARILNKQEPASEKTNAAGSKTPSGQPEDAGDETGNTETEKEEKDKFTIDEDALVIRASEVKFAGTLFEFIPSARATKRFSNVYRLLKASVLKKDLASFEGSGEYGGDFKVPMLLLAIVSGSSTDAVRLFPYLQNAIDNGKSVKAAISEAMSADRENKYELFLQKLSSIINEHDFPADADLFRKWIPKVARYSFDLSRILAPKKDMEHA